MTLPETLSVGAVLDEKYRVVRTIGAGGMGLVFEAEHLQLNRRVAIKVLKGEGRRSGRVRLRREAQAIAALDSEHICRVFDFGELPSGDPFMVMELLEGQDLAEASAANPPAVGTVIDWMLQACVGLAQAHASGIVHRDLKPSNLFVATRRDGTTVLKILDFGISKTLAPEPRKSPSSAVLRTDNASLSETSGLLGSPRFMSPEQVRDARQVDARTDIWALGVLTYELVSGRPAFDADTMEELLVSVLHEAPPSVDTISEQVPSDLSKVIDRCLNKDPKNRFPNVVDLAAALVPFGGERARRAWESLEPFASTTDLGATRRITDRGDAGAADDRPATEATQTTTHAPPTSPPRRDAELQTTAAGVAAKPPPPKSGGSAWRFRALAVLAAVALATTVITMRRGASSSFDEDKPAKQEDDRDWGISAPAAEEPALEPTAASTTKEPAALPSPPQMEKKPTATPASARSSSVVEIPVPPPPLQPSVRPQVDCTDDKMFERDEFGDLRVRPECR